MSNTGRVTQHTIQPNISPKPLNAPPRRALPTPHKKPAKVFCDPIQLLFSIKNAEQRSGHTTHHTAKHSIQHTTAKHSQGTARNLSTLHKKQATVLCDPTQLLYPLPTDRGHLRPYPNAFLLTCLALYVTGVMCDRPYPPHRGRTTHDSEEVGSHTTPLPRMYD